MQTDNYLRFSFGLNIAGVSSLIASIFGIISFFGTDELTASGFILLWPVLLGLVTLFSYLLTRIFSKEIALGVVILFALINVFFNLMMLVIS